MRTETVNTNSTQIQTVNSSWLKSVKLSVILSVLFAHIWCGPAVWMGPLWHPQVSCWVEMGSFSLEPFYTCTGHIYIVVIWWLCSHLLMARCCCCCWLCCDICHCRYWRLVWRTVQYVFILKCVIETSWKICWVCLIKRCILNYC